MYTALNATNDDSMATPYDAAMYVDDTSGGPTGALTRRDNLNAQLANPMVGTGADSHLSAEHYVWLDRGGGPLYQHELYGWTGLGGCCSISRTLWLG